MACVLMLSHLIRDESRSDWHQIEQIRDWNLIRKSHRFLWPAHVFDVVKSGVTVRWRLWPRRRCIGHWVGGGVVAICARFPLLQIHAAFQVVVPLGARSTTLLVGDAVDTLVEATFVVRVRVHLFAHTHFFYLADDHLLCVVTSGVNKPRHVTTDWRTLVDWRVFPPGLSPWHPLEPADWSVVTVLPVELWTRFWLLVSESYPDLPVIPVNRGMIIINL